MFPTNLNRKFSYSLKGKTYKPSWPELRMIYDINRKAEDWLGRSNQVMAFKKSLKEEHYFGQKRRCAYCRASLRTDAYWEDLDHIVAQSVKGNWIFYPKNLIVTCEPCNRLKNADPTLSNVNIKYFPLYSSAFKIFNPHFDNWSDHFRIDKGIFLKGIPGTKGPDTYEYCKLHRHDIIIDYVDQQRIWGIWTMRRLTHRLRNVKKGSLEEGGIIKAIEHLIKRKKLQSK